MKIPVLYQDSCLLICEKPAGILSEASGAPALLCKQEKIPNLFPVHRLDQATGGILILAKTPSACGAMQQLFQTEQVVKEYLAVACARPSETEGFFSDLLFHDKMKNKTFIVDRERKGVKRAELAWITETGCDTAEGHLTRFRIRLHTGRSHQIRAQFGFRGWPLTGDGKYGSRIKSENLGLWATHVSFLHPFTGQRVDVVSLPPSCFPWNVFDEASASLP